MFVDIVPGYLTHVEAFALFHLVKPYNKENSIGVEIGSLHGRSSTIIAQSIPLAKLYCIDTWNDFTIQNVVDSLTIKARNYPENGVKNSLDLFKSYTRNFSNILYIQGHSPTCVKDWKNSVDFIFLDANKTNPDNRNNIDFWITKVKPGGLFIGHDYHRIYPDVVENVQYLEKTLNQKPFILASLWAFKIK